MAFADFGYFVLSLVCGLLIFVNWSFGSHALYYRVSKAIKRPRTRSAVAFKYAFNRKQMEMILHHQNAREYSGFKHVVIHNCHNSENASIYCFIIMQKRFEFNNKRKMLQNCLFGSYCITNPSTKQAVVNYDTEFICL